MERESREKVVNQMIDYAIGLLDWRLTVVETLQMKNRHEARGVKDMIEKAHQKLEGHGIVSRAKPIVESIKSFIDAAKPPNAKKDKEKEKVEQKENKEPNYNLRDRGLAKFSEMAHVPNFGKISEAVQTSIDDMPPLVNTTGIGANAIDHLVEGILAEKENNIANKRLSLALGNQKNIFKPASFGAPTSSSRGEACSDSRDGSRSSGRGLVNLHSFGSNGIQKPPPGDLPPLIPKAQSQLHNNNNTKSNYMQQANSTSNISSIQPASSTSTFVLNQHPNHSMHMNPSQNPLHDIMSSQDKPPALVKVAPSSIPNLPSPNVQVPSNFGDLCKYYLKKSTPDNYGQRVDALFEIMDGLEDSQNKSALSMTSFKKPINHLGNQTSHLNSSGGLGGITDSKFDFKSMIKEDVSELDVKGIEAQEPGVCADFDRLLAFKMKSPFK